MKKRFLSIILTFVVGLTIYGCSSPSSDSDADANQNEEVVSEDSSSDESETKDNTSASGLTSAEIIPDPTTIFSGDTKVKESSYDEVDTRYEIENFKDEDYEKYIEECFADGSLEITHQSEDENGETIYASDKNDEFFVEIYMHTDDRTITISSHLKEDGKTSSGSTSSEAMPDPNEYFVSASEVSEDYVDDPYTWYSITGYTSEELDAYITACKEAGFTNSVLDNIDDGSGSFYAVRDDEELYIDITADKSTSSVSIVCNFYN